MKEQVQGLIKEIQLNGRFHSIDEAATKQAIILRFLSYLGWDPYSLDQVSPEYSVGGGKIDYALRYKGSNKVFIEVKRVGEDLDKHQDQLLNYSFKAGVALAVLTNGISWWFYLPLKEGSWEQRKFYAINIEDQDAEEITQKFIDYLSKEFVISGKAVENAKNLLDENMKKNLIKEALPKALEKIFNEPEKVLVELMTETTENICGFRPDQETIEKYLATFRTGIKQHYLKSEINTIHQKDNLAANLINCSKESSKDYTKCQLLGVNRPRA